MNKEVKYVCEDCKNEINENDIECPYCGALLKANNNTNISSKEEKINWKCIILLLISILFLINNWSLLIASISYDYHCRSRGEASCLGMAFYLLAIPSIIISNFFCIIGAKNNKQLRRTIILLNLVPLVIYIYINFF